MKPKYALMRLALIAGGFMIGQQHWRSSCSRKPRPTFDTVCRIFATGRKSWLFSDTVEGARASAAVYSIMLTCRACGVEPLAYLRHVLTELPQRTGNADISDLLPFNFLKAATD